MLGPSVRGPIRRLAACHYSRIDQLWPVGQNAAYPFFELAGSRCSDVDPSMEPEKGLADAHPPLEIPGHGTFAIYIQGGVHHGLWQL